MDRKKLKVVEITLLICLPKSCPGMHSEQLLRGGLVPTLLKSLLIAWEEQRRPTAFI